MKKQDIQRELDLMELALIEHRVGRKALADTVDAQMHAGTDKGSLTLTFYAARFTGDRPDKAGDVISPDAFNDWYRSWKADPQGTYPATNGKLVVCLSHKWDSPSAVLGYATPDDVTIDSKGLLVSAHLFDTDEARRVYDVAKEMGYGASFAYEDTIDVRRNGKHGPYNLIQKVGTVIRSAQLYSGPNPLLGP